MTGRRRHCCVTHHTSDSACYLKVHAKITLRQVCLVHDAVFVSKGYKDTFYLYRTATIKIT